MVKLEVSRLVVKSENGGDCQVHRLHFFQKQKCIEEGMYRNMHCTVVHSFTFTQLNLSQEDVDPNATLILHFTEHQSTVSMMCVTHLHSGTLLSGRYYICLFHC